MHQLRMLAELRDLQIVIIDQVIILSRSRVYVAHDRTGLLTCDIVQSLFQSSSYFLLSFPR